MAGLVWEGNRGQASPAERASRTLVLNFAAPPPLAVSAALFRLVGQIDPELFETDTSGYTQFGALGRIRAFGSGRPEKCFAGWSTAITGHLTMSCRSTAADLWHDP